MNPNQFVYLRLKSSCVSFKTLASHSRPSSLIPASFLLIFRQTFCLHSPDDADLDEGQEMREMNLGDLEWDHKEEDNWVFIC